MTDHDSDDDPQDWEPQTPPTAASPGAARPWLKPLLLFAIALACGLVASGAWMWLHQKPAAPAAAPSGNAVTLDPGHRPLPAPMAGGSTNLPPPASPSADAPHIVVATPEASAASPESMATDAASGTTEASPDVASPAASETVAKGNDSAPQVVDRIQPDYPDEALRTSTEGTVNLAISVDAQGKATDVRVTRGSGSFLLDRAAIDAVRRWHYKPAMHDGQPVAGTIEVPIDFRMEAQR
ncbi:MAG TPA: TonB family protein [Xanthomonadaceae bacterium]|jgi:TonB family protein